MAHIKINKKKKTIDKVVKIVYNLMAKSIAPFYFVANFENLSE